MLKKIALAGVGMILLAAPAFVLAQSTDVQSQIAALLAEVKQLQALILQLQQGSSADSCNTFAYLKRGDTDATTSGKVSKLQAYLGISPTTGYYGPLTGIGYNNKCVGGNAQPTSVAGMSKYSDSSFGFSFWYPSGWTVSEQTVIAKDLIFQGDDINQTLKSFKISNGTKSISIAKITSKSGINELCGSCSHNIYFDTNKHQWIEFYSYGGFPPTGGGHTTNPADVSANTMGGLHIIDSEIVPLSANNFLIIETVLPFDSTPLIKTIVATDPTVAIPLSTAQQTATIQAEANAYGISVVGSPTDQKPAFTAQPTTGQAPLNVSFYINQGDTIDFGDGSTGCSVSTDTLNCFIPQTFMHTYTKSGTYLVQVGSLLPARTLGTAKITVIGN